MTQLESSTRLLKGKTIKEYLTALIVAIKSSWYSDTAYLQNTISAIFMSVLYLVSFLTFIEIIYTNFSSIAGYGRDEMLLFVLIGNVVFHLNMRLSFNNIQKMIKDVNTGELDLLMLKPMPTLFHISFRNISIWYLLTVFAPQVLLQALLIDWGQIEMSFASFSAGIAVLFFGMLCLHVFQFLSALPVFWFGESEKLLDLSWVFEYNVGRIIPFDGFPNTMKSLFTFVIPVLFATGMSSSVMLGKTDPLLGLFWVISVSAIVLVTKRFFWDRALTAYTSASS